jgi:hypothetical protein
VTAADVQATVEYLVPGFIGLKLFYVAGLRTRRSDFGWTVLSIAASAILNWAVTTYLAVADPGSRVVVATVVGVLAALVGAFVWRRYLAPRWRHLFDRQVWDDVFDRARWVQIWIKDGPIVIGAPRRVSESADTDDQDLYVRNPSWVDKTSGERTPLRDVHGFWIAASEIRFMQFLRSPDDPPWSDGSVERPSSPGAALAEYEDPGSQASGPERGPQAES